MLTDRQTDKRTDKGSNTNTNRVACAHLKSGKTIVLDASCVVLFVRESLDGDWAPLPTPQQQDGNPTTLAKTTGASREP